MNKWDKRYLDLAKEISSWSKDPSTKVGAVAIGNKGHVLSQGYNGFPRGIEDNEEILLNREAKYKLMVHAEQNCIYNATYNGISLKNSSLYVYGLQICNECAKAIIQVGISRVVMDKQQQEDRWKESMESAQKLFKESGVIIDILE